MSVLLKLFPLLINIDQETILNFFGVKFSGKMPKEIFFVIKSFFTLKKFFFGRNKFLTKKNFDGLS